MQHDINNGLEEQQWTSCLGRSNLGIHTLIDLQKKNIERVTQSSFVGTFLSTLGLSFTPSCHFDPSFCFLLSLFPFSVQHSLTHSAPPLLPSTILPISSGRQWLRCCAFLYEMRRIIANQIFGRGELGGRGRRGSTNRHSHTHPPAPTPPSPITHHPRPFSPVSPPA